MAQQFEDRFHRQFYYLRLSVTDVCNFRCQYCLPDGYRPEPGKPTGFLGLDEIRRVVEGFAMCGTNKVRITGGEPSMRRDFTEIIETVASTPGIRDVATTTNGYRLKKQVSAWREAGLTKLNVSIDSLDPKMFHLITGENRFHDVMAGIDAAFASGFEQVKVNTVLLKNRNSHDFRQFLAWIKDKPIQLRFIELMQTGQMDRFFAQYHQSGVSLRNQLLAEGWQLAQRRLNDGPAEVYQHPDYLGEIGLILPYDDGFCESCNRLRVSAKGKLHLCLFGEAGVELRDLLANDASQDALIARIRESLQSKKKTHFLHQGNSGMTPHLASIGG
ncbi:GTP 3',8-cyclase MoaA [Thaumasiovibrio subtropicus]|uniref:GTP 3',8-cyclase MoaA n=1 Tax=Thaumasiovibrio subtropicus TaxID=1891207 RepID=UPI000B34C640|nr:GTP 3',8-cyclase MoaA [Thaumasiovibrio subtropicus]